MKQMKWQSEESPEMENYNAHVEAGKDDIQISFFDVEVYPNLFVVCWKYLGSPTITKMINPSAQEVEAMFKLKLVGFNNRRYDNHILYARYMGYNNKQLFDLSQKLIANDRQAAFGEAYNLSYTDIWDFSSVKQGLKKFQIDLGIFHSELDIPWDQPVPEELWDKVVAYCCNDVESTEAVWEDRKGDWLARSILADLSGLSVNSPTQQHTAKIIFNGDKNHKEHFVYTNLAKEFPGYAFDQGKSTYRGEVTGEGGYVYAEPGIYENVAVLDVASMHPASIEQLGLFGKYTQNYVDIRDARLAIKRKDYETARTLLDGRLEPYLGSTDDAEALS
jgi:hypothetical protein